MECNSHQPRQISYQVFVGGVLVLNDLSFGALCSIPMLKVILKTFKQVHILDVMNAKDADVHHADRGIRMENLLVDSILVLKLIVSFINTLLLLLEQLLDDVSVLVLLEDEVLAIRRNAHWLAILPA